MTPKEMAAQLLARCNGGFENHFEHANWKTKHLAEIEALPYSLRKAVLLAHDQATIPEFSEPRKARG